MSSIGVFEPYRPIKDSAYIKNEIGEYVLDRHKLFKKVYGAKHAVSASQEHQYREEFMKAREWNLMTDGDLLNFYAMEVVIKTRLAFIDEDAQKESKADKRNRFVENCVEFHSKKTDGE